jgi:hypothetical protein
MKRLILIILMSSLSSAPAFADKLDFNNADQQLNLAAGFAVNLTAYSILKESTDLSRNQCLLISTAGTILLSVAKETLLDSKFSSANFKSATLGAGIGVVVPFVFDF